MDEDERKTYDCFLQHYQRIVERYHRRGVLLKNYAHIFAMMIRLRQLCCHRQIMNMGNMGMMGMQPMMCMIMPQAMAQMQQ